MTFVVGRTYSRTAIGRALGGSWQAYLPTVGGRVVCGAFKPAYNPEAPAVVLAGFGPVIESSARAFHRQGRAVPVFLKRATNAWEYRGEYRVRKLSDDQVVVRAHAVRADRAGDVSMVLFLEPARARRASRRA